MPRRATAVDKRLRVTWSRWFEAHLAAIPADSIARRKDGSISVSEIARQIGNIPPSRPNVWLRLTAKAGSAPMPDLAYRVGETLNRLGSPDSNGPMAALAVGALPEFISFLLEYAERSPRKAIELMAFAPVLLRIVDVNDDRVRAYAMREVAIQTGLIEMRPRLQIHGFPSSYGSAVANLFSDPPISVWTKDDIRQMRDAWDRRTMKKPESPHTVIGSAARDLAITMANEPLEKSWPIVWSLLVQWAAEVDVSSLIEYEELIKSFSADPFLNRFIFPATVDV